MKKLSLVPVLVLTLFLTACGARSATGGDAYNYVSGGNVFYASNGDAYYYASDGNAYYFGNIYASDGDAAYYVSDGDAEYYAPVPLWESIYVATDGDAADNEMYLRIVYDSLLYNSDYITPEEFARALVEMVSVMTPEEVERITVDWLAPLGNDEQTAFADSMRSMRGWCEAYALSVGQEKNESLDMVYTVLGLR